VHPTRKIAPGSEVHACLGRNVYVLWSSPRRGVPTTVDDFRAAGPSCIVLERGAGALRVASQDEGAAGSVLHTDRLLFVRGKERTSIFSDQDVSDVQLLLEAPSAGLCASWVTGGASFLTPWEALLGAGLTDWNDATCVHEVLMSMLPPLPEAADDHQGFASRILGRRGRHFVLNAQHWLAPSASVGLAGASAIGTAADTVDQVPVVGPVLRLCLLVVQVGTLAVLADGHDARRKDAVQRCEAIAFDVLCRIFEPLRKDPTEFGAAYVEQLCSLMAQVESILEQVEATSFMTPVKDMMADAIVHGWEQQLKDIHDKLINSSVHGAVGRAVDRVEHGVGGLMKRMCELGRNLAGSLPSEPDLSMYEVGWLPPVLGGGHVAGVDKHGRVEHAIVSMLEGYAREGAAEAPRIGVYGIGGCGKSTACAEVATCERVRTLFPLGTVWVQLSDTSTSETVATAILALVYRFCGEAATKRCQQLTGRKDFVALAASDFQASLMVDASKWLIIIDDVRYEQVGMLTQLLLVVSRTTPVLFTTRSQIVVALVTGAVRLSISSWPEDDARALLARAIGKRPRAIGKRPTENEPVFSAEEEAAWVRRVLDLTQCHVLSVSIVAALLSARCGMWRPIVAALEHQWTDPSFQRPLTDMNPMRSVRATLDVSRGYLPNDDYRRAFAAVGILPANEQIGLHVLDRLWRPQLGVIGDAAEGACPSRLKRRSDGSDAVHPSTLRLLDALVRAGLLHLEVADGDLAGVVIHPVVCGYAHSLLCEDGVATHHRLVHEYTRECPADDADTHGWLSYHVWAAADDGYWYNNVARHAAASEDVLALASLMTDEWYAARARTGSLVGHQADVALVLASLRAIVDDEDHSAHNSPMLLGAAHWGLAMGLLHYKGYQTAAIQEAAVILLRRGLDEVSQAAAPFLWAEMQNDLGNVYSYRVNGDKAANFQKAVRCYYNALEVRMQDTLAWAETQHCLGMAYADREGGNKAANMEEALAYFRRALDVRTRDAAPLQWADSNLKMGAAYAARVDGGRAANLQEAMACYRRALEVWTRETAPLQWAAAQQNMGRACAERVSGNKAANIEEAVAFYRRALHVRTREAVPLSWALTQHCLGLAYAQRVHGEKAANLEEAVICFGHVLDVWTRESMPLEWATTQLELAEIYERRMGVDKDAQQANMKEMLACYRRTLEVWTRETAPYSWARMQDRMGSTHTLGVDRDKAENLEAAVACYRRALEVWTQETTPQQWATTQVRLADIYKLQMEDDKEADEAKIAEMKECYRRALEVWTRETAPTSWAETLSSMGSACVRCVGCDMAASMEEALSCFGRVLQVWTRDAAPRQWALMQVNMAYVHRRRASGGAAANLEEALVCYQNALEVLTREHDAQLWAGVQYSMGTAYAERVYGDKAANLEEAVACYRHALEVRTQEATPQLWAKTTWCMVVALQGGERWAQALEKARALQAFGSGWKQWDQMEAPLVARVTQLEREV